MQVHIFPRSDDPKAKLVANRFLSRVETGSDDLKRRACQEEDVQVNALEVRDSVRRVFYRSCIVNEMFSSQILFHHRLAEEASLMERWMDG